MKAKKGRKFLKIDLVAGMKAFRTDGEGCFRANEFKRILEQEGIELQMTTRDDPRSNAKAERLGRTLVEMARTMLSAGKFPKRFWWDAMRTACYLKRRLAHRVIGCTPYEIMEGHKPNISHLRVWGCVCYAMIPEQERQKLDVKSRKCLLMGYEEGTRNYILWDINKGKEMRAHDVIFNENYVGLDDPNLIKEMETVRELESEHEREDDKYVDVENFYRGKDDPEIPEQHLRRSTRVQDNPNLQKYPNYKGMLTRSNDFGEDMVEQSECCLFTSAFTASSSSTCPKTLEEAFRSPKREKWKAAVDKELQARADLNVFKLVRKTPDMHVLKNRWVFAEKTEDGKKAIEERARLDVKGYFGSMVLTIRRHSHQQ